MHIKNVQNLLKLNLAIFSLLFSYSKVFGLEAPVKEDDVAALHDRILIVDGQIDIPLALMNSIDIAKETDLQTDFEKYHRGKVDAGVYMVYSPQGELTPEGYERAVGVSDTLLSNLEKIESQYPDKAAIVRDSRDFNINANEKKHSIIIGVENAYALGEDLSLLEEWARRGVSFIALTHRGSNQLADSSLIDFNSPKVSWGGLSPLGERLIGLMNQHKILVDVSHLSKKAMVQASELTQYPLIASHSVAMSLSNHPRNLDDEQLKIIKESGGVVQVVAYEEFIRPFTPKQEAFRTRLRHELKVATFEQRKVATNQTWREYDRRFQEIYDIAPQVDIAELIDHLDYIVKLIGIDYVGIGSNFNGAGGVKGWMDASDTLNVTKELVRRGYSEQDIEKLWGRNLQRVLSETDHLVVQRDQYNENSVSDQLYR